MRLGRMDCLKWGESGRKWKKKSSGGLRNHAKSGDGKIMLAESNEVLNAF